jgi:hypothetical protein
MDQIIAAIVGGAAGVVGGVIGALAARQRERARFAHELELQEQRLRAEFRTEFMAEQVAAKLLNNERWTKRSFPEIRKRIGGFEDQELRKILVRARAVRFEGEGGIEL